jgi:hypothetical protein
MGSVAMERECAFCGRAEGAIYHVFCQDCQAQHRVCPACAESSTQEAAQLGLEPSPQAALT